MSFWKIIPRQQGVSRLAELLLAEGVIISSYILTYASRSAKVPVLTVRLKEGCEDKGIGTFGLQEQLLLFLKEYETPSKLLLKLQETQPNVFAIGINNSIREFRCPEWLSVCSPKGVFFLFFSQTLN